MCRVIQALYRALGHPQQRPFAPAIKDQFNIRWQGKAQMISNKIAVARRSLVDAERFELI